MGSKILREDGRIAYEKVDNEDWGQWVNLLATYPVETLDEAHEKVVTLVSDNELPMYKADGSLNRRFWFKWSDEQVAEHYGKFMTFEVK